MRRTEVHRARLLVVAMACSLASASARAQSRSAEPDSKESHAPSLRSRLGVASAERWLASDRTEDRLRALERLGSDGSPRALALIAAAVAPGGALTSVQERLSAARVLAPHARTSIGRETLIRLMSGSGAASDDSSELERFARRSAALALSDSGDPEALAALSRALRHEGSVAETAAIALSAHPPSDLNGILGAIGRVTPTLVELLDELGDRRAVPALRELVRHGTEPIRTRAALALGRLGDPDTLDLARYWLAHSSSAALRRTATELLALGHADDAAAAITALIENPATNDDGLDLALAYPTPALAEPIARHLAKLDARQRAVAYAVLGRSAAPAAIRALAGAARSGSDPDLAMYALATSPSADARDAIAGAFGDPALRRDGARAGVIRALALDDQPDGLGALLTRLAASNDPADRAAGAWGTASLDPRRRAELIASGDAVVAAAAARTAIDSESRRVAAERLARAASPDCDAALAIALTDLDAARIVPTSMLVDLLETPSVAPVAVRALAARGGDEVDARLEELSASGDPVIRAHLAFGLGARRDPSAVGHLDEAYRFEPDPQVRRAVVRALGLRREPTRRRTLDLAARLDPDAETRRLAVMALRGVPLPVDPRGDGALWLSLDPADVPSATGSRALAIVGPTGLALPVQTDPDGRLPVWGLPRGPVAVRLAPASARGKASKPVSHHSPVSR